MPSPAARTDPETSPDGLTSADVAQRVAAGQVNVTDNRSSRSLGEIVRANIFTLFNGILTVALVLIAITGRWADGLFGIVMVFNTVIGVATEYRAKRTLDKLAILSAPHATVTRDGERRDIAVEDVVLGDLAHLSAGDQIPADGLVLTSNGLEVDESLLTGESRPVHKAQGDEVLSGASVVAGTATYQVTRVGADGYANKLTAQAKRFSTVHSELQAGINKILAYVSVAIVPISLLLFWSQLRATGGWETALEGGHWQDAIVAGVAGVVGMIPEGLVLLTSMNFALAALIVARQNVLVQELPAVEVLARVDVLCLDKTGTITTGQIELTDLVDLPGAADADRQALAALVGADGANATAQALARGLASRSVTAATATNVVPFSSARKWSAVATSDGAWVLGAPELVLAGRDDSDSRAVLEQVKSRAQTGARVVLCARVGELPDSDQPLPADVLPVLLAVLGEEIRPDAAETLAYFRKQGVRATVISGDNPDTVAAIATSVGLLGEGVAVEGYDARNLPEDLDEIADVLDTHHVFGRVVPEQKRALVHALQRRGHVVAMTGDGVNDSLALKDADLGVAMGNGAPATKAVARIVLLDGRFSTLPGVLGQGRRVMANMERVSTLFLTKTTYSFVIALTVVLLGWAYPFLPRQMTLAGSLTIGIPAFFLALPPNNRRYLAGFLRRVLGFALPAGVVMAGALLVTYYLAQADGLDVAGARTAVAAVLIVAGLWIVGLLARPFTWWKVALIAALASAGVIVYAWAFARSFFLLEVLPVSGWQLVATVGVCTWVVLEVMLRLSRRASERDQARRAQVAGHAPHPRSEIV